jgi:acetyl esterase/lipase
MARVWQPLDPDFVHKLVPEYVEFHKANLVNRPRADQLPWDPSVRDMPAVLGSSAPIPVRSIKDYSLSKCKIRVFTPEGAIPSQGWPVFIFFHGGMLQLHPASENLLIFVPRWLDSWGHKHRKFILIAPMLWSVTSCLSG